MIPRWALALSLLAALATGGCSHDGTLQVSWDFLGGQAPASGCGQHGVDSILIQGADTTGDSCSRASRSAPPGTATVSVAEGTWTVKVTMLDFQGATISAPTRACPAPAAPPR